MASDYPFNSTVEGAILRKSLKVSQMFGPFLSHPAAPAGAGQRYTTWVGLVRGDVSMPAITLLGGWIFPFRLDPQH